MRVAQTFYFLFAFLTTIHALALPASFESISEASKELWKRKGGGGGGGKGGSSSSSGSSSSGSSSSGSSGSGGGGRSGGSSSSPLASSSSNTGGRTASGTGPAPAYGGGRYYGGGAAVPYRSGGRSPGGVAPYFLGAGALAFFPGIWLYGAYAYPYGYHSYHNNTSNRNESLPVQCLCDAYSSCGCDNNTDSSYYTGVANNGTVSRVADVNGTRTLVVNGTLPNGTTASGGVDDTSSAAGSAMQSLLETSGWWVVVAGATYTAYFL